MQRILPLPAQLLMFALSFAPLVMMMAVMVACLCNPPRPATRAGGGGACIPCQQTPAPMDGGGYLNGCLPTLCAKTDGGALCCTITPAGDGYHYTAPDGGAATID